MLIVNTVHCQQTLRHATSELRSENGISGNGETVRSFRVQAVGFSSGFVYTLLQVILQDTFIPLCPHLSRI